MPQFPTLINEEILERHSVFTVDIYIEREIADNIYRIHKRLHLTCTCNRIEFPEPNSGVSELLSVCMCMCVHDTARRICEFLKQSQALLLCFSVLGVLFLNKFLTLTLTLTLALTLPSVTHKSQKKYERFAEKPGKRKLLRPQVVFRSCRSTSD